MDARLSYHWQLLLPSVERKHLRKVLAVPLHGCQYLLCSSAAGGGNYLERFPFITALVAVRQFGLAHGEVDEHGLVPEHVPRLTMVLVLFSFH